MNNVRPISEIATQRRSVWWPTCGGFALAAAVFVALYWTTAVSLAGIWAHSGMFQYAFLIFPVSVWLAWSKRDELIARQIPRAVPWAVVLLAGLAFMWLLGRISNVDILEHVAFIATFPVLVLAFFGVGVVRALVFPLAYLVFAIPAGVLHSMVGPLQTITAVFSVKALQLTGTPVFLQGHSIMTPWMTAHVEEACSGVRFFLACTALGLLFAYLMFTSLRRRIGFIIAAMIVPIIANGLRVYFTILIGGTFGVQYAKGTDHLIFGWQFFGTVLALLFIAGWFLRQPPPAPSEDIVGEQRASGAAWQRAAVAAVAALAVFAAAPVAAALIQRHAVPADQARNVALPVTVNGWSGPTPAASSWQPRFVGADVHLQGTYSGATQQVGLFAAQYLGAQTTGHDLLAYANAPYDKAKWSPSGADTRRVTLPGGHQLTVREVVVGGRFESRIIWYWYQVNGRTLTSKSRVRAWQAWDQLKGTGLRSGIIAVSTILDAGGNQAAQETLADFVSKIYPQLTKRSLAGGKGER